MFESFVFLGGDSSWNHEGFFQIKIDASNMEEAEKKFSFPLDKEERKPYNMVVFGGTNSSGAALSIASQCNIKNMFYIIPDQEFPPISKKQKLQHKIAFNVLQEYAKSGLMNLILISNSCLSSLSPEIEEETVSNLFCSWNKTLKVIIQNLEFILSSLDIEEKNDTRIMSLTLIQEEENGGINSLFPLSDAKRTDLFIFGEKFLFKNKSMMKTVIDQVDNYQIVSLDNNCSLLLSRTNRIQSDPIK